MQLNARRCCRCGWQDAARWVAGMTLLALLAGCSATRYVATPTEKMTLQATAAVNPDRNGRPSPIEVRIYELASRSAFDALDFDAAWSNAEVVLGDQLLSSSEHVLLPRQAQINRIELSPEAAFIAVVAAYRDINKARWKLVYPVRPNWFNRHTVILTATAVDLESRNRRQARASDVQQ